MRLQVISCLAALLGCASGAAVADELPSSERSREAVERVRPVLEQALSERGLRFGAPIFVRIFKQPRQLELWVEGEGRFELFRVYDICTYSGRLGPKLVRLDLQSPEGFYFVTPERLNPSSAYHLSFNLGYPNAYDRRHGRTGSALMVHGSCVSNGCYAMTDERIEEIYALADAALRGGQPFFRVHIFPFRMTDENLRIHGKSRWSSFWTNLRQGHDWFETEGRPPNVVVREDRYAFESPQDRRSSTPTSGGAR